MNPKIVVELDTAANHVENTKRLCQPLPTKLVGQRSCKCPKGEAGAKSGDKKEGNLQNIT